MPRLGRLDAHLARVFRSVALAQAGTANTHRPDANHDVGAGKDSPGDVSGLSAHGFAREPKAGQILLEPIRIVGGSLLFS